MIIWGNPNNAMTNKTFLLQKKAIRAINKANYNAHTDPLFKQNKLLKFTDLFTLEAMRFFVKLKTHKLPISFNGIFPLNNDIHPHRQTRQSHLFAVKPSKSTLSNNLRVIACQNSGINGNLTMIIP